MLGGVRSSRWIQGGLHVAVEGERGGRWGGKVVFEAMVRALAFI